MKVLVGSKNPNKIAAVKEAFEDIYSKVSVKGISVESGVSHTPQNKEVLQGAMNRAKQLMENHECDYAVGMEGGVIELYDRRFLTSYVVILNKKKQVGVGSTGLLELPPSVLIKIDKGIELSEISAELAKIENVRQKGGIIGFLTADKVPRGFNQKISVYLALSRFLHTELWKE